VITIEPYSATYEVWRTNGTGKPKQHWEPCRVLGIAMRMDEPKYLIETYLNGEAFLDFASSVRPTH
jgi:hypothetical protein